MNKTDMKYKAYIQILEEELKPAMGCTEPISLASACPTKYWLKQAAVSLKT